MSPKIPILVTLAAIQLVLSPITLAQAVDQIVVTGSRLPSSNEMRDGNVFILDRSAVERFNPVSVVDVLRGVPGLSVSQQGGGGGVPFVSIRGGEENFALILLDGVKVNDPTATSGGGFDFAFIDPNSVERVEIVKGPVSPIYGSGSLSGAINIITAPEPQSLVTRSTFLAGSFDRFGLTTSLLGPINDSVSLSVSGGWQDSGDEIDGDQLERVSGSARLSALLGNGGQLKGSFLVSDIDAETFPQASGGPRLAAIRESEVRHGRQYASAVSLELPINRSIVMHGSATWSRLESQISNPGIAPGAIDGVPPLTTESTFDRYEAIAYGVFSPDINSDFLVTDLSISTGVSLLVEDGVSEGVVDFGILIPTDFSLKRQSESIFAEVKTVIAEKAELSASVRHDDPESFKGETNFSLKGTVNTPVDGLALNASWGQGFKLPSFFAVASPLVGNPDLRPESSSSFSAGITAVANNRYSLAISYFDNTFKNLIDFDPNLFSNFNRGLVKSQGVEVSGMLDLTAEFAISFSATHTNYNLQDKSETDLRLRPSWQGKIGAQWRLHEQFTAYVNAFVVGERTETVIPLGLTRLAPFEKVDVSLEWRPTPQYAVKLGVNNLFDKDYEESAGFPAPRFGVHLSLSTEF